MTLQEKVLQLKKTGLDAVALSLIWQRQIDLVGEEKATAVYTSLGLNHIETGRNQPPKVNVTVNLLSDDKPQTDFVTAHLVEKKSFQWEGLTLSREPRPSEVLAVKGVSQAQESAKESITKILLDLRTELIADGLKNIEKLEPNTYHTLTLWPSAEARKKLRERLIKVHRQGRLLVAAELGRKEALPEDEFDLLDDLVDITDSRVANDIQSRLTAAATRFRLLGLEKAALWKAVEDEVRLGSVSYIDRASQGLANRVVNIGRMDEMRDRSDGIDRYEQSALLDPSTCEPCLADDGKTASDPEDLPGGPNPDCLGSDYCRCFVIAIAPGG